jgi:hypothetical protein
MDYFVVMASRTHSRRNEMPFLIPVLIGVPVIVGGGYMLVHFFH